MLRAILNKSWRQHPTRHELYGHLPPITKTMQVRRTRHAGHCWRSKDELISDILLRTAAYGQAKAGRPARTYIQQLCKDTGCHPEDLPKAMNDREKWRERVRDIRAGGTTWWWWWWLLLISWRRWHFANNMNFDFFILRLSSVALFVCSSLGVFSFPLLFNQIHLSLGKFCFKRTKTSKISRHSSFFSFAKMKI